MSFLFFISIAVGCNSIDQSEKAKKIERNLSDQFEEYWFSGLAEINTYAAQQARYGEIHPGKATLIFVTEPFSKPKQVKLDHPNQVSEEDKVHVLKLNALRKFNTGIYPYSMMTSTFTPLKWPVGSTIKLTSSSQEWCGHAFLQLNRTGIGYTGQLYSYFESEGDQGIAISSGIFEDELFSQIRLAPSELPKGEVSLIPNAMFLRFKHIEAKAYKAICSLEEQASSMIYSIDYQTLGRRLIIYFDKNFPHTISKWEEQYISGFGESKKNLTSVFKLEEQVRLDYWRKNSVDDAFWRDSLGLYQFQKFDSINAK